MAPMKVLYVQTGWIFIVGIKYFTQIGVGTWRDRYFFSIYY